MLHQNLVYFKRFSHTLDNEMLFLQCGFKFCVKTGSFQKVWSHFAQWNFFLQCVLLMLHQDFYTLHIEMLFLLCVLFKCYIKTCLFQKVSSHFAHWNAFSPVCTFSVTSRLVHFKRFSNILPIGMLFLHCVLLVLHQNLLISKGLVTPSALKCLFTCVCALSVTT